MVSRSSSRSFRSFGFHCLLVLALVAPTLTFAYNCDSDCSKINGWSHPLDKAACVAAHASDCATRTLQTLRDQLVRDVAGAKKNLLSWRDARVKVLVNDRQKAEKSLSNEAAQLKKALASFNKDVQAKTNLAKKGLLSARQHAEKTFRRIASSEVNKVLDQVKTAVINAIEDAVPGAIAVKMALLVKAIGDAAANFAVLKSDFNEMIDSMSGSTASVISFVRGNRIQPLLGDMQSRSDKAFKLFLTSSVSDLLNVQSVVKPVKEVLDEVLTATRVAVADIQEAANQADAAVAGITASAAAAKDTTSVANLQSQGTAIINSMKQDFVKELQNDVTSTIENAVTDFLTNLVAHAIAGI